MEGNTFPDEGEETVLAWARNYAREHGWELNPDEKQLSIVIRGLARNRGKFGVRYCPCRLRSGDVEKDRVLICPCNFFLRRRNRKTKGTDCYAR